MYLDFSIEGDELHKRMGGGLYLGQIITISGGTGEGKTLLSLRLIYGLIKNGYQVAYVSSQLPIREFVSEADSLGYPILNEILSNSVLFITTVFLLRKTRRGTLDQLIGVQRVKEKQILVIDSFQMGMFSDFDINDYFAKLRKFSEGRIVILTVNPSEVDARVMNKINELSTTIINLHSKELAGSRKHSIELVKFPMALKSFQQSIPFRIEPGRGLIVEISSVS